MNFAVIPMVGETKNFYQIMAEKTYFFDSGSSSQSSIDPNLWAALNNGGGFGGGFGGGNWFAILFLLVLFGRDGLGRGGYNMDYIGSQLTSAAQGNANAISNLSTQLNCSNGQILSAINAIQAAIQSVGAQNNLSFAQTINAVNSGDASIISALQSCCCDVKQLVTTQGYENRLANLQQSQLIQNGFSQVGYAAAENACAIKQTTIDNTNRIIAKIDAVQDEAKNNKINELTAALTAANSRAERQAELAPIYKALSDIQCKQPNVVTVPANNGVLVPSCVAWQMGLNGLGLGYGYGYANGGQFG